MSKAHVTLDKCQLSGIAAEYTLFFPQTRAQKNAIFTSPAEYNASYMATSTQGQKFSVFKF